MDYCHYTSIPLVLAFRSRLDGKTEDATFSTVGGNTTNAVWYIKNRDIVKDIVHQIRLPIGGIRIAGAGIKGVILFDISEEEPVSRSTESARGKAVRTS